MNAECLINLSQAVAHGSLRRVKNYRTEQQGVVVQVMGEGLTVNIGSDTEVWGYQDCEEVSIQ
ncbi:hypothetical protein SAMN02745165_01354 [Malonomonas rubra DSM 5091]|uniref:Uncharacterized protein n=1 Tax=Malonomonas rubra DSM 5091 TaxID=1122189 RepID=A0A1M6FNF7_MALRU|nr:hypothetical protein [Malonomonas rubra]SHI99288.1 hypothetical protein SAMN02745165_01354 [Malonomonas rubra DSM 5091]